VGAKNRERRRAKQKARHDQQRRRQERMEAGSPFGWADPGMRPAQHVANLAGAAVNALHAKDDEAVRGHVADLADGSGWAGGQRVVDAELLAVARREVSAVWGRGWQPADVVRAARRAHGSLHVRVAVDMMAAEMRGYAAATVDEGWEAQLREFGATVWWERDDAYLPALAEREGMDSPESIRCLLEVLHVFATCPPIQVLCPPPGTARRGALGADAAMGKAVDTRQLDRVRALLAKAESTNFAEEAETYTAKAQELMARYSIDYALLSVGSGVGDAPIGRRIGIDNPYEAPKALLLDAVARANRCRAIWSSAMGFVTVLGFTADLDAVELLFTSLLVQATAAMMQAGSRRDGYGRSTTRSFRQSFLTAYAQRIGERLTAATTEATAQASRDLAGQPGADRLLPVLASRGSAVRAMTDDLFPELVGRSISVSNRDGWASGRAAADQARLTAQRAVDR
jgi:Protein of unknown function (DUF2786)